MTLIIAHRGFSGKYLDNSYESLMMALEMNVDMIELDIRLCQSGELVVFHDWRVGEDLIHKCSLNYLKRKYQLMSLEDVLQIYHLYSQNYSKSQLLLDIKTPHYEVNHIPEQCSKLIDILHEYISDGVINYHNFVCSSFNKDILKQLYHHDKQIRLGFITSYISDDLDTIPTEFPIYSISLYYNELTKIKKDKLKEKNIKLFLYTVNSSYDLCNFINLDVDGVITDYPDKIYKIMDLKIPKQDSILTINYS